MSSKALNNITENGDISSLEAINAQADGKDTDEADVEFSETSENFKKAQRTTENADNAKRRRDEERRQRAIREARESGIIEALGGLNPYTGEAISDSRDVDEYLAMKEIENDGGDPLTDFARYHKRKQKAADEAVAEESRLSEWIEKDRENFISKYPDVDISELVADESFRTFAEGKTGNMPLADIYAGYASFVEHYEKRARSRAAQIYANHKASPGSLGGTVSTEGVFTPEQVRAMSRAEVAANLDAIKKSMKRWK